MPIILNGTTGITTPGITNTGPFTFQGVVELPAGAVGAPSLTTTGDTNTGIYFPAADTIAFTEGGVESARFDSSGRFLVKTTSNTQSVVVNAIELGGSGAADTAQPHSFIRANVGTTADYSGYLVFARSRGTTDGATTIVASGDRLGMIRFSGANGTSFSNAAEIYAAVDGTPGASNDMPGRIMFATSSDGSATPTERMRLDSSGALLIGGVGTTKSVYAFNVINDSTFNYGGNAYRIASIRSGSGDQRGVEFGYDATSGVGVIAGATQGAGTGLAFWTYNSSAWGERARITADGNFGVGTTGPTYKIEGWVANSGTLQNGLNITNGANADFTVRIKTGETWIGPSTSTPFVFVTNSTERARIVGNGDFGIGTSGPAFKLDVSAAGEVISGTATTGSNMRGIRIYNTTTATTNNAIGLWLATGPHQAGIASFRADAGGGWETTLAFYTHGAVTSGLNDCYERMRITGEGNLLVGATSGITHVLKQNTNIAIAATRIISAAATTANQYGLAVELNGDPNNSTQYLFAGRGGVDGSTDRAVLRSNGGLANYQANDVNLSDQRVKKDIKPLGSMWDKFKAIEIVTFKYNDQTHDDDNIGVIAQQVESVAPEFIDVDGFGETPEGEEPLKTVYTTDMYHAAIKALQEAMARIEVLEADMAVMKGLN